MARPAMEVEIVMDIDTAGEDHLQDGEAIPEAGAVPWYVIWTTPRKEEELLNRIRAGVSEECYEDAWIPMRIERRKYRGRYQSSRHVLFPRYIFVETDQPECVHEFLRKRLEYIRILGDERGSFCPISKFEQRIISMLTGDYQDAGEKHERGRERSLKLSSGIIKDGRLLIIDGPLKGFEEYVVYIDRHKMRAEIEMELFGEKRRFSAGLIVKKKE